MRKLLVITLLLISWTCFSQVSSKTSLHCGTQNKKAREYFDSGNFGLENNLLRQAKAFFIASVKLDSTFCDAWDNLSVCCRRMEQYDEAFISGLHSVMIDSTNAVAWLNCGYATFLSNDIYESLTSFDHLQRIIPNNPEGYYGKSMVLYSIDSISEAHINISKALQMYKKGNLNVGKEVFLLKGFIEYRNGNKKEAQDIFEDIYSKYKDNAELNYFLGQCLLENENDIKKANKYFDRAKALGYAIDKSKIQNN